MATKTRSINCTLLQCNHTHLLSIWSFYCTTWLNFNTLLYFIVLYMYVLLLVDIFPILYYTILHCTVLYCTCTLPHHFPKIVHYFTVLNYTHLNCFLSSRYLQCTHYCTVLYTPVLLLVDLFPPLLGLQQPHLTLQHQAQVPERTEFC